jgi:integrase
MVRRHEQPTLTEKRIAKLIMPGRYAAGEVKGLSLQITKAGVKSWLLRYELNGRERWMGLGPIDLISLKEARNRARAARVQLLDGIDPLEAKAAAKLAKALEAAKQVTFEKAATEYFEEQKKKWKSDRTSAQFESSMKAYVYPEIGALPVASIDKALVLKVVRPLWATKTETMDRVRKRVEDVLDYSAVSGYRSEGDNPARWEGFLEHVLPARQDIQPTQHLEAMPYQDLPAFYKALKAREGIAARALEFLILTVTRTGATLGAQWTQVDFDRRMFTVTVKKGGRVREIYIPLCKRAMEILNDLPREGDLIFGNLQENALRRLLAQMGCDKTVHGFRSSFSDWGTETTGYPDAMFRLARGHKVGDATELAYRRGTMLQKRYALMEDWSRYCETPTEVASGKLIPIRKAQ